MSTGPRREEHRALSFALALAMHGLIAALLYFGVQWQTHPAAAVEVELWAGSLEAAAPPPPLVSQAVVDETPPAVVEPEPEPVKADIELEKPVPAVVTPKPKPANKPPVKKPEPKKPPVKQPEIKPVLPSKPVKAEPGKGKLASATQGKLTAPPLDASVSLAALAARQQAAEAAGRASLLEAYYARVRNQIRRNMTYPDDNPANPEAEFTVTLLPDMTVLSAELKKSSGNPAFDEAVKRAILGTRQYPALPPGVDFGSMRKHNLKYRLHDL